MIVVRKRLLFWSNKYFSLAVGILERGVPAVEIIFLPRPDEYLEDSGVRMLVYHSDFTCSFHVSWPWVRMGYHVCSREGYSNITAPVLPPGSRIRMRVMSYRSIASSNVYVGDSHISYTTY